MANRHRCSDGTTVTEGTIRRLYHESKKKKYEGLTFVLICEGCNKRPGNDNDHTIAQARCKHIGKTELIWNPLCYVWSCRQCHQEWENFKSGNWIMHKNVKERLQFMKKHDPEGFNVRINLTIAELESHDAKASQLKESITILKK